MQYPGQTLFVPSNWFHTVENLEPAISINHNWINRHNILLVWDRIKKEMNSYYNLVANIDSTNNINPQVVAKQLVFDIIDLLVSNTS